MVSCLTLVRNTHILAGQERELSHTVCGLSIASVHVRSDLFVDDPGTATCKHCQQAQVSAHRPDVSSKPTRDPKPLVARLIEQLNANDAPGLERSIGGRLAGDFTPERLKRLHQMFPAWQATIDELIAEGDNVVLRYHVTCTDAFDLLGSGGLATKRGQLVILRLDGHRVIDVSAIVDDFGLWVDIAHPTYTSRGCVCHPGAPANYQCTTA
jgi:predicted ester cyclase